MQAACGLTKADVTRESKPMRTIAPILDYSKDTTADIAVSAALFEYSKIEKGCDY